MVCNVQDYFNGMDLNMTEDKIESSLSTYLRTGRLDRIDTRKGHPLARITSAELDDLYRKGKYHIATVLNTDRCI